MAPTELDTSAGGAIVARFNPPHGDKPFGIDFDLEAALRAGLDPNAVLLHELAHAWQWFRDPAGFEACVKSELIAFGYLDAPHEVEARELAAVMVEAGVRVFFPSPELAAEIAGYAD
jgi:hypothetical protein